MAKTNFMKHTRMNGEKTLTRMITFQEERLLRYLEAAGDSENQVVTQVCLRLAELSLLQLRQLQSLAGKHTWASLGKEVLERKNPRWEELSDTIHSEFRFDSLFLIFQIEREAGDYYAQCIDRLAAHQLILTTVMKKHRRQIHAVGQALENLICHPN